MIVVATTLVGLLLGAPTAARSSAPILPAGFVDLDTCSRLRLDLSLGTATHVRALVPELSLQMELGWLTVGLESAFSWMDVAGYGSESAVGGLTLKSKGSWCRGGVWELCWGGEIGFTILPSSVPKLADLLAAVSGMGVQTMRFGRFASNGVTLEPILALAVSDGSLLLQATFGSSVFFPTRGRVGWTGLPPWTNSMPNLESPAEVDASILGGLDLGIRLLEELDLNTGLTIQIPTSFEQDASFLAMHLDLRLNLPPFRPHMRLRIPLDDGYSGVFDLVLTAGLDVSF